MSVTAADRDTTATGYVPVQPFPVSVTSVLSQNQVASDAVVLDATDSNDVAAFCNPTKGGASEAFAIIPLGSNASQVVYVSRDSTQPTGWKMAPLPGGPNGVWPANSVVAVANGSKEGLVDVFWDDGKALQHTWLQPNGTFAAPRALLGASMGALGVSYSVSVVPGEPPIPTIFGITSAGVQLLTWSSGGPQPWTTSLFTGSGFTASAPLTVAVTATRDGGQATVYSGSRYFVSTMSFKSNSSKAAGAVKSLSGSPVPVQSVIGQATTPNGQQVAYAVGTDDVPYVLPMSGQPFVGAAPIPAAAGTVSEVIAVPCPPRPMTDGSVLTGLVNMYVVHGAPGGGVNLSLLRQIGWTNGGTLPQWSPPVPVASGVDGVFPSLCPTDPDTIFIADRDNLNALAAYSRTTSEPWRNAATGVVEWSGGPHWSGGDIRQPPASTTTYDITSYIVQATVTDSNGYPMVGYPLQLSASSDCGVVVGGSNFPISRTQSTPVTTNSSGIATFSVLANDFAPPSLILTDPAGVIASGPDDTVGPVSISPAASVQTYLSASSQAQANGSTGTLPYLAPNAQTFNATMMTSATVPDDDATQTAAPLFPGVQGSSPAMPAGDAVTNINNMMALGYSPATDDAAPGGPAYERAPGSPAGFIINNSDPTRPAYLTFESGAEMRAAWRTQHRPRMHLFHKADDLFSDAWKGIKDGATKVADVAVDMEKGVVSMAIWIGKEATEIGDFVITCVEDACNAIAAVFSALESAIKDIIKFLKALFDFGNIFDTQWAFQQAINQGLVASGQIAQWAIQQLNPSGGSGPTTFFSGLTDKINDTFDAAVEQFTGQTVQQAAGPNWQPMGQPPSNTQTIGGATTGVGGGGGPLTPAQTSANPQASWMQSQLGAQVSSGTASDLEELLDLVAGEATGAVQAAVDAFDQAFDDAMKQFEGGAKAFEQAFEDLLNAIVAAIGGNGKQDPNNLQNVAMVDLLNAERELLLGMLDVLDGVALAFLGMVDAGITWLLDVVNTPIKGKSKIADAVQLLYDGLWDLARLKWQPPQSGWAPPAGVTIPGWDPTQPMPKDLTFAGLVGLVTGFPVYVLYEILTGKAPFPGGVLPIDDGTPGADQAIDELNYELILAFINELSSTLGLARDAVLLDSYADPVVPPTTKKIIVGLSGLSFLSGASSFIFQWRGREDWGTSIASRSIALAGLLGESGFLSMYILSRFSGELTWRTRMCTVATLFGVLTIAYADSLAFTEKKHVPPADHAMWAWATAMGNLAPIPAVLSLLVTPEAQEASGDLPIAGCVKLVVDAAWLVVMPALEIGETIEVSRHTSTETA